MASGRPNSVVFELSEHEIFKFHMFQTCLEPFEASLRHGQKKAWNRIGRWLEYD